MSLIAKQKHIMNDDMWDDYALPAENHYIVKVVDSPGNNLHEVITPAGEKYMVTMPTKFRNLIWVRRDSYVLVEPITEGVKVKGEIVKVLNKKSIKYYKENNIWPKEFDFSENKQNDEDDIFVNPNRIHAQSYIDSDSSDSSDTCED